MAGKVQTVHGRRLPARRLAAALMACALAGCTVPKLGKLLPDLGAPRAPVRVALVIGNAAYENATPLANPGHDADDMCGALKKQGFRTLCHTNLRTRAEFEQRVQAYADLLQPGAEGVVYYSGHGVQAGQANYLVPTAAQVDAQTKDPLRALYPVGDLFDRMKGRRARFQYVVLDACRTDIFRPPPGRSPADRSVLVRTLEVVARAGSGLQAINDAPEDTIVLYATASRATAYDGEGRNGPLTKQVLAQLPVRGQDIQQFNAEVIRGVVAETAKQYGQRQVPYTYGSFGGKFCFAGCVIPPPVLPAS